MQKSRVYDGTQEVRKNVWVDRCFRKKIVVYIWQILFYFYNFDLSALDIEFIIFEKEHYFVVENNVLKRIQIVTRLEWHCGMVIAK